MKKFRLVFSSILIIIVLAALVVGGTIAEFSDSGSSTGNTFAAGTLDLKVDGSEDVTGKFDVTNFRPGNQPKATYVLTNEGSMTGYLNINGVSVVNDENGITPPEASAGDVTDTVGELGNVVNLRLLENWGML